MPRRKWMMRRGDDDDDKKSKHSVPATSAPDVSTASALAAASPRCD